MISLLHYSAKLLFLSSPLAHTKHVSSLSQVRNISANSQRQKWSGPHSAMVGNVVLLYFDTMNIASPFNHSSL